MFTVLFVLYSAIAIGGAVGVLASANVVRMAVCLTTCLGAVSGLFLLDGAAFVAAAQLLVYVGGTIILLIFGVMLTAGEPGEQPAAEAVDVLAAGLLALVLGGLLVAVVLQIDWGYPSAVAEPKTAGRLGLALLGTPPEGNVSYLLPFELVSVHLLVVLVGAAYLARATRTVRGDLVEDVRDDAAEPVRHVMEPSA